MLERRDGFHSGDPSPRRQRTSTPLVSPGGVDDQAGWSLGEGGELALDQFVGGSGELLAGRLLASAPVKATWRNGAASTTRTRSADRAHRAGLRITTVAIRYQRPVACSLSPAVWPWRLTRVRRNALPVKSQQRRQDEQGEDAR